MHGRAWVIEQSNEAQAPGTLCGASIYLAFLQTGIAEDALLGFAHDLVEVDLLIWARLDAVAVSLAAVLIDNNNPILFTFIDSFPRTRLQARGVGAMIADPRQVEEIILVLVHSADIFVPVDARLRLRRRHHGLLFSFVQTLLVVVLPGMAVVVHRRQRTGLKRDVFPASADPIPLARIAEAGSSLDIVPVHVAGAVAVSPQLLAGDRAGLAAQALVKIHHHCVLVLRHGPALPKLLSFPLRLWYRGCCRLAPNSSDGSSHGRTYRSAASV